MNDLQIKKKDFEKKKNDLKEIINNTATEYHIEEVDIEDKHLFGLLTTEHKVSGTEMNNFIMVIQSILADIGETDAKLLKEFQIVYDTFDSLDKEYINGILGNIKNVEKLSKDIEKRLKKENDLNKARIKELLQGIVDTKKELEIAKKQRESINKELEKRVRKDREQDKELERQAKTDEYHDEELKRQAGKDEEHDRRLDEGDKKDKIQDEELKRQAGKDEEHDRRLDEGEKKDRIQDEELKRQSKKDEEHDRSIEENRRHNQEQDQKISELETTITELKQEIEDLKVKNSNRMIAYASLFASAVAIVLCIIQFIK